MTQPGIEPQSPGPLANTLLIRPMARNNDIVFGRKQDVRFKYSKVKDE